MKFQKINYQLLSIFVLGLSVLFFSQPLYAASINGNATAKINTKIAVAEDTAMDFAIIAVDSTSQTVALSNAGVITCPSQYTCTGTPAQGAFTITSTSGETVNMTYTNGTLTGPGTAMAINVTGITAANTASFTSTGSDTLNVGAELVVGASQTAGSYSGTYVIDVNY